MWRRRDRRRARYKERILEQLRAAPDRWLDPADIQIALQDEFPQEALQNYDILQELVEDGQVYETFGGLRGRNGYRLS